jgi:hypothetical protein
LVNSLIDYGENFIRVNNPVYNGLVFVYSPDSEKLKISNLYDITGRIVPIEIFNIRQNEIAIKLTEIPGRYFLDLIYNDNRQVLQVVVQ